MGICKIGAIMALMLLLLPLLAACGGGIQSLAFRGAVTAISRDRATVETVNFKVVDVFDTDAARAKLEKRSGSVGLSPGSTVITYTLGDGDELELTYTGDGVTGAWWSHQWLIGEGNSLEPGEIVEFTLGLSDLPPGMELGTDSSFMVKVTPGGEPTLRFVRTTPSTLTRVIDLG